MAFTEDLSPFFNDAEFASRAALVPEEGGAAIAGVVIYDENGTTMGEFGVETASPTALFPLEQWPRAKEGDTLQILFASPIGRRDYRVRSVVPQGDGKVAALALVRL